ISSCSLLLLSPSSILTLFPYTTLFRSIAEPSQDGIVYTHKGTMDIQVISKGKSSHSSMPELGYNAINPLVDFIHYLNKGLIALRSEEHTSELQSRFDLVCRLLLEKKNR